VDLLREFESWLLLHRRPQTVRNRLHYARQLQNWCQNEHVDIFALNTRQVSHWVPTVGAAPATRKNAVDAINVFFNWAVLMGFVDANPAKGIPRILVPSGLPNPTPDDVLQEGIDRCETVQDLLMLMFASYGGLRVAEIAVLHATDIQGEHVRVHGKGGKIRYVPLHPVLHDVLRDLDVIGWLFPSGRNPTGHYLPDSIAQRIRRYLLRSGWTAHTLRHRFATEFYRGNPNLLALRELLGHASVNSTMIYTRVSPDALAPHVAQLEDQGAARRWTVLKQHVSA